MKKHYVSIETAKVLKEKGYNELCTHYYDNGILKSCISIKVDESIDDINCSANLYIWGNSAPELHEVQQWLREEHKVEIVIGIDVDFTWRDDDEDLTGESVASVMYHTYDICICNRWLMTNTISCTDNKYTTYKEALEAGINEALKMI